MYIRILTIITLIGMVVPGDLTIITEAIIVAATTEAGIIITGVDASGSSASARSGIYSAALDKMKFETERFLFALSRSVAFCHGIVWMGEIQFEG